MTRLENMTLWKNRSPGRDWKEVFGGGCQCGVHLIFDHGMDRQVSMQLGH